MSADLQDFTSSIRDDCAARKGHEQCDEIHMTDELSCCLKQSVPCHPHVGQWDASVISRWTHCPTARTQVTKISTSQRPPC